jgi:hypothetical protein
VIAVATRNRGRCACGCVEATRVSWQAAARRSGARAPRTKLGLRATSVEGTRAIHASLMSDEDAASADLEAFLDADGVGSEDVELAVLDAALLGASGAAAVVSILADDEQRSPVLATRAEDVEAWCRTEVAAAHAPECVAAVERAMAETVGDLLFLVPSAAAALRHLELSAAAGRALWEALEPWALQSAAADADAGGGAEAARVAAEDQARQQLEVESSVAMAAAGEEAARAATTEAAQAEPNLLREKEQQQAAREKRAAQKRKKKQQQKQWQQAAQEKAPRKKTRAAAASTAKKPARQKPKPATAAISRTRAGKRTTTTAATAATAAPTAEERRVDAGLTNSLFRPRAKRRGKPRGAPSTEAPSAASPSAAASAAAPEQTATTPSDGRSQARVEVVAAGSRGVEDEDVAVTDVADAERGDQPRSGRGQSGQSPKRGTERPSAEQAARTASSSGGGGGGGGGDGDVSPRYMNSTKVGKTAIFEPFIYKMHYFTKTGSGQT